MTNTHELLKACTRREQQHIKAIFFLLQTKKLKNIDKIFLITRGLIKEDRKAFTKKAGER